MLPGELDPKIYVGISRLQKECYRVSKSKGFHDERKSIAERLCLIHSEVSEAMEEIRKGNGPCEVYTDLDGKPEGFGIELADIIIRTLDLAEETGVELWSLIERKMKYNETRPYKHGKKF